MPVPLQCDRLCFSHAGYVVSLSLSPDGLRLVSGSIDNMIRTWDVADLLQPRNENDENDGSMAITPSSERANRVYWVHHLRERVRFEPPPSLSPSAPTILTPDETENSRVTLYEYRGVPVLVWSVSPVSSSDCASICCCVLVLFCFFLVEVECGQISEAFPATSKCNQSFQRLADSL